MPKQHVYPIRYFDLQLTLAQELAARLESEGFLTTALDLMEMGAQEWELELAWAQGLRDRLSMAPAGSNS
jgi:hypothetical protein